MEVYAQHSANCLCLGWKLDVFQFSMAITTEISVNCKKKKKKQVDYSLYKFEISVILCYLSEGNIV
jgi:hypothetical protein